MIGNDIMIRIEFFSLVVVNLSEWKTFNNHLKPMQVDSYQYNVIEDLDYMSKSNEHISSTPSTSFFHV